jgi:two-component system nitrate/nitrite response regulator NarL
MSKADQQKIRLLLVEDQMLVREGLARLLEREPDLEIAARCANVSEAVEVFTAIPVDVVLLDYVLSGEERGTDFLARAAECGFRGKVLVVTGGVSDPEALHLLRHGVAGIFLKEGSPELLANAVRKVMGGELWLGQREMKLLLQSERERASETARSALTDREIGVLRGIFQGLANKEIGTRLRVSEATVKAALQQLFRKNNVNTRGQLVRIAMEKYQEALSLPSNQGRDG